MPKLLTQKAKRPVVNIGRAKKMDMYINMNVLDQEELNKVHEEGVGAAVALDNEKKIQRRKEMETQS